MSTLEELLAATDWIRMEPSKDCRGCSRVFFFIRNEPLYNIHRGLWRHLCSDCKQGACTRALGPTAMMENYEPAYELQQIRRRLEGRA